MAALEEEGGLCCIGIVATIRVLAKSTRESVATNRNAATRNRAHHLKVQQQSMDYVLRSPF